MRTRRVKNLTKEVEGVDKSFAHEVPIENECFKWESLSK